MAYVEGFVVAVPAARLTKYRRLARQAAQIFVDHGALSYLESVGEDVTAGKTNSFPRALKLRGEEVIVFGSVKYRSRKHRDSVMKKVMADERMQKLTASDMPFDPSRMIHGGFKTIVDV